MTGVFRQMLGRVSGWLDRMVESDPRFICAACDDRFPSRALGAEHVWRCHPEYVGVLIAELAREQEVVAVPVREPGRLQVGHPVPALRSQQAWG